MLLTLLLPGFSILAEPAHAPHEDPAITESSLDIAVLLFSYSEVFDLAAISQYQDARDLLEKLEQANIPDDLRYIIDRYNTLIRQLFTSLDNLESTLDEISILIADNQISQAEIMIDEAKETIRNTEFLLEDIDAATNVLSDKFDVFGIASSNPIVRAYSSLENSLQRIRKFIDTINNLLLSLEERNEAIAVQLLPTELGFSIATESVFVGDNITATGRLSSNGNALPQRKLTLFLDNEPLVITTDPDGSFTTTVTVPYKYVSSMTLNAVYVPSGDDIGTYLDSWSPPIVINTKFHPTHLELLAPKIAYPGLPFTVNGKVTSPEGNIEREIRVFLDDILLTEEVVNGHFSIKVTSPPEIETGKYNLTAVVVPQGRSAGATTTADLEISIRPVYGYVQMPQLALISRPIQVSGWIYYGQIPPDVRISLNFKNSSSIVRPSTDGSFTSSVDVPFDLSFISSRDLTLTIEPFAPRYAPVYMKMQVITINPVTTGLMMVLLILIGLFVYARGLAGPGSRDLIVTAPLPAPIYKVTGVKGRILSAYISGLDAIVKLTNVAMAPHTTLREFLRTATPLSPPAVKPFAELTTIAEVALYSTHGLNEKIAATAESLATAVREEL